MLSQFEEVNIFTNGDLLDYELALKIYEQCKLTGGKNINVLQRPTSDLELLAQINAFDKVVAARLHANIVALSLGIPSVGLVWDTKVASLYQEIDMVENAIDMDNWPSVGLLLSSTTAGSKASINYESLILLTIAKALSASCKA
jgi:polysaccharide pyruvyl transferase WcaK-like protein